MAELDHQTRHRLAMYVRYGDNIAKGMIEENDRLERDSQYDWIRPGKPRCMVCGGPADMNASRGPACQDHYDDLSD